MSKQTKIDVTAFRLQVLRLVFDETFEAMQAEMIAQFTPVGKINGPK
jgi:hypothetical protein